MHSDPVPEHIDESVRFLSQGGLRLEGLLSYPSEAEQVSLAVLLCPPHPFLGGDMNGNVLRALRKQLTACGMMTLSFNYRGIGRSETDLDLAGPQKEFWEHSTCPGYESRIFTDAAAAYDQLREIAGEAPLAVVGYSFGCLPALSLASRPGSPLCKAAIVSPPLGKWTLTEEYLRAPQPKAVFYSTGDFACPQEKLDAAFAQMAPPKTLHRFEGCSHFYIGREEELASRIADFLRG